MRPPCFLFALKTNALFNAAFKKCSPLTIPTSSAGFYVQCNLRSKDNEMNTIRLCLTNGLRLIQLNLKFNLLNSRYTRLVSQAERVFSLQSNIKYFQVELGAPSGRLASPSYLQCWNPTQVFKFDLTTSLLHFIKTIIIGYYYYVIISLHGAKFFLKILFNQR
jgi:hypothetical protein